MNRLAADTPLVNSDVIPSLECYSHNEAGLELEKNQIGIKS